MVASFFPEIRVISTAIADPAQAIHPGLAVVAPITSKIVVSLALGLALVETPDHDGLVNGNRKDELARKKMEVYIFI